MADFIVVAARLDGHGDPVAAHVVDLARRRVAYFGPEGRDPADPARAKSTVAKAVRDVICGAGRFDAVPSYPELPATPPVVVCAVDARALVARLAYLCGQPRHGSAPLPPCLVHDPRAVLDASELIPDGWAAAAEADAGTADFRERAEALDRGERTLSLETAVLATLLARRGYAGG